MTDKNKTPAPAPDLLAKIEKLEAEQKKLRAELAELRGADAYTSDRPHFWAGSPPKTLFEAVERMARKVGPVG